MPDTIPLVSLAEIKEFCEIAPAANPAKDLQLLTLARIATSQIEEFTGRIITPGSVMEFLTSKDATRIETDISPYTVAEPFNTNILDWGTRVRAVDRVYSLKGVNIDPETIRVFYDPRLNYGPETELTRDEHFELGDDDTVILHIATRHKLRALKFLYSAGFPAAPTPPADPDAVPPVVEGPETMSATAYAPFKQACLMQVQFLRVKSRPDNVGMEAERTSGSKDRVIFSKFTSSGGLIPEARALVARWRRVRVGSM